MKKPFFETVVGRIAKNIITLGIGMIIKNQKGIKGTKNEKIVDEVLNN